MTTQETFVSHSLQVFSDEADLVISKHLQDLDRVSNDIKALEGKLKQAGIPFNFVYSLFRTKDYYSEVTSRQNNFYGDCTYRGEFIRHIEHCLNWGKNELGESRLWHVTYEAKDEIDSHDDGDSNITRVTRRIQEPSVAYRRPLIETKSNFRLRTEGELPIFYRKIIEALANQRDQDEVLQESPNFIGEYSLLGLPF